MLDIFAHIFMRYVGIFLFISRNIRSGFYDVEISTSLDSLYGDIFMAFLLKSAMVARGRISTILIMQDVL
jgi:hypothetical protein